MDSVKVPNSEEMSGVKRIIVKGFEATGIYPFNPNKVLEKIPNDNANVQETVNDSLVNYLSEKRYPSQGLVGRPRKRTRLNIAPSISITSRHFEESCESDGEIDDNLVDNDAVSDHNSEPNEGNVSETEDPPNYFTPNKDLKIGSFILVKVISGRLQASVYKYVAVIKKIRTQGKSYEVQGLKSMDTSCQVLK